MNNIFPIRCLYVLLVCTLTSCAIPYIDLSILSNARFYLEDASSHTQAHGGIYTHRGHQVHAMQCVDDQVAYFAAKGNPALRGSGEVAYGDNELFFYGFCTPHKTLTMFLQKKLPQKMNALERLRTHNYTDDLADIMKQLMVSFYKEHDYVDPCDTASQDVLIGFLHLIDNKMTTYVLHCIDGTFKRINEDNSVWLNRDGQHSLYINMLTSMQAPTLASPLYDLLKKNDITRQAMLAKPKVLAKRIMETDSNEHIKGIILFNKTKWLKKCKCPATTHVYKNLQRKWDKAREGVIVSPLTKAEKQILKYAKNPNRSALLVLAAQLRTQGVSKPVAVFLDDIIEKHSEETPSPLASISNIFT